MKYLLWVVAIGAEVLEAARRMIMTYPKATQGTMIANFKARSKAAREGKEE